MPIPAERDIIKPAFKEATPWKPGIASAASVVLISSDYHMDRAVRTARSAGFTNVLRLPAPSSLPGLGANVMSEVVLELNELTLKR